MSNGDELISELPSNTVADLYETRASIFTRRLRELVARLREADE